MQIGVLALQGDFIEHIHVLQKLGVVAIGVRTADQFVDLDGLIIPGGESTTIGKLAVQFGLINAIKNFIKTGKPVWGTCAGMILLARDIGGLSQPLIGAMDITVQRNAFGRQADSFEQELIIEGIKDSKNPFRTVFIRAPLIKSVGPGVEVLCKLQDDVIIAARQGNLLATSFHPELTDDTRIHEYFLKMYFLKMSVDRFSLAKCVFDCKNREMSVGSILETLQTEGWSAKQVVGYFKQEGHFAETYSVPYLNNPSQVQRYIHVSHEPLSENFIRLLRQETHNLVQEFQKGRIGSREDFISAYHDLSTIQEARALDHKSLLWGVSVNNGKPQNPYDVADFLFPSIHTLY